ncbi:MAG: hypothetical protein MJZ91_01470 [Bacteroidales bacterium]|nr:hypothetical protein [Bacteroidales bacterium]
MTLLVSWVAIDQRKPSSAYIMTDSRITWSQKVKYDFGCKVMGCNRYPDIFGYCGDVLYPLMTLRQLIDAIDAGLLYYEKISKEEKQNVILNYLNNTIKKYPKSQNLTTTKIIHVFRINDDFHFSIYEIVKAQWKMIDFPIPNESGLIYVGGSGKKAFENEYRKFNNKKSISASTSRNVFQCFIHTLKSISDLCCGGPPQLIGLYRKGESKNIGIIYDKNLYFHGMQINNDSNGLDLNIIQWYNEKMESCDSKEQKILADAMRQPNPLMD